MTHRKIKTVGMVVAMQKEIMPLIERSGIKTKTVMKYGFEVTKFTVADKNIVCVKSGVGELHAAAATQLLIGVYKADVIINFGVCGALKDKAIAETVLVKGVVHYDFDLSPIDPLSEGQYPDEPSAIIETDKDLRKAVKAIDTSIGEAICASGDKFVADENIKSDLAEKYGAEICEMESAGVLITAKHAAVPCVILKAVSDGKGGAEEFKEMVDRAANAYIKLVFSLLERL